MANTTKTNGNAIVAQAGLGQFAAFLKEREGAVGKICASHVNPTRMTRVLLAAVSRTPALQQCTMQSLAMTMMQSAELGLEIGSAVGEAYAVPFRNNKKGVMEAQFIPGYRGLITLAYRSGAVTRVLAQVVYEGDEFEYEYGLAPKLSHVPCGETDPAKITHAYCIIYIKDAEPQYDVMTRSAIDQIRSRSRASGSGPWVTDFAEMARKTVTRRALKYVPMSIEMSKAIAADVAADTGDFSALTEFDSVDTVDADFEDVTEPEPEARKTGVDAVKSKVNAKATAATLNLDPTTELRGAVATKLDTRFSTDPKGLSSYIAEKLSGVSLADANHDQLVLLNEALDAESAK